MTSTKWESTFPLTTPNGFLIAEIDFEAEIETDAENDLTIARVEISVWDDALNKRVNYPLPYPLTRYFEAWFETAPVQKSAREAIQDAKDIGG